MQLLSLSSGSWIAQAFSSWAPPAVASTLSFLLSFVSSSSFPRLVWVLPSSLSRIVTWATALQSPCWCEPSSAECPSLKQADLLPHCQEHPTADFMPSQLLLRHVWCEIVSPRVSQVLVLLQVHVLYQEGQLLAGNKYSGRFYLVCTAHWVDPWNLYLVCTAHWMDPWKWRRNESYSGMACSETMSFDSVYNKIHFHCLGISQSWIIWQNTSAMQYDS